MYQRLKPLPTRPRKSAHRPEPVLHQGAETSTVGTYFQQSCPTCGRRLLILVTYLGRRVTCSHCGRTLVARDTSSDAPEQKTDLDDLRGRIEQLLATLG